MDRFSHIEFTGRPPPVSEAARAVAFPASPSSRPDSRGGAGGPPLSALLSSILARGGLPPDAYQARAMERRLGAVLRRLRVSSVEAAEERLEREPNLLPQILDVVLIGVTSFFRDPVVFDNLRETFLPEMVRRKRNLRILSVGCSRGHELYSIAILLAEAGILEACHLLGFDCRPEAIAKAQKGLFPEKDFESLPLAWRHRYFEPSTSGWVARACLRNHLHWRVENALLTAPPGLWDIVLFRNVAIYLDRVYAEAAWTRLVQQVAPGGLIVTGKADPLPGGLTLIRVAPSIYRRRPE